MDRKLLFAVFASLITTLLMVTGYKMWNQKKEIATTPPAIFRYAELPNDLVAQYGSLKIKTQDLEDLDLAALEQELRLSQQKERGLLELNALSSQIFRKKLEIIRKKISDSLILQNAKQQNKTAQEYLGDILEQKDWKLSAKELKKELQQLGLSEKDLAFEKIKDIAQNKKRQKLLDEEINKNFLKNPILTTLKPPTFKMPLPKEWTPHWGLETAPYTLVVFSDFVTQSSQILNKSLLALSQRRPDIQIYWRPYFENQQDAVQNLMGQASICLWQQKKNAFFYVLYTLEYIKHDTAETDLYSLAGKNNFNVEELKKCVVQQKYRNVMDYHLKYGNYLQIKTLPTLFINGEAIAGEFREEVLENLLQSYR